MWSVEQTIVLYDVVEVLMLIEPDVE